MYIAVLFCLAYKSYMLFLFFLCILLHCLFYIYRFLSPRLVKVN
nr:MAG TPA: hypothetical protein [Caudoviricetes sp.]